MNVMNELGDVICTRFLTVTRYRQNISVNIAKQLIFPTLRGTWLPSFDKQSSGGLAINWMGIRIRVSKSHKGYPAKQTRRPRY